MWLGSLWPAQGEEETHLHRLCAEPPQEKHHHVDPSSTDLSFMVGSDHSC